MQERNIIAGFAASVLSPSQTHFYPMTRLEVNNGTFPAYILSL